MIRWSLVLLLAAVVFSSYKKKPVSKKNAAVKVLSRSLAFPVAGKRSNIGSFWGASRDGGKRRHEGIDIFARKGTAVLALTDGVISYRGSTARGGKVLWLNSNHHPWSAYYAHLDKQLVKEGQAVRKGQVIGTVGNTGNARTTPSHLHFGMYTVRGPMNPLPYVKHSPRVAVSKTVTKKRTTARSIKRRRS